MPDEFELYPCMVDGQPASIYVNMRFEDTGERAGDTVYWLAVKIHDPGPHGIGTAAEAEVLDAFEEAAIASVAAAGLVYAGRMRSHGIWEITFYGEAGHEDAVSSAAHELADHRVTTKSQLDRGWSYYQELLLPDAERRQWIDDRRLVQVLQEQGDRLHVPRRVDHWAVFPSQEARDAFIAAVRPHGFDAEIEAEQVRVWRTDPIELDHIHDVVMLVLDAAEAAGGDYDGWETSIESG